MVLDCDIHRVVDWEFVGPGFCPSPGSCLTPPWSWSLTRRHILNSYDFSQYSCRILHD